MWKTQDWLANWDLSAIELRCEDPQSRTHPWQGAVVASEHRHRQVRGSMRLPTGRWMKVAEYSGAYTPELACIYARGLALVLVYEASSRADCPPAGSQRTALDAAAREASKRRVRSPRKQNTFSKAHVIIGSQPVSLDDDSDSGESVGSDDQVTAGKGDTRLLPVSLCDTNQQSAVTGEAGLFKVASSSAPEARNSEGEGQPELGDAS